MSTSKKAPKFYVIRTFLPFDEPAYTSMGVMADLTTFEEKTVEKQYQAIIGLTGGTGQMNPGYVEGRAGGDPTCNRMVVTNVSAGADLRNPDQMLQIIDFRVQTSITDRNELRDYRDGVREAIKLWAEKSRIPGLRGWRANAIKTPSFEASAYGYVLRFQVILGTSVFYSKNRVTVGTPANLTEFYQDAGNLKSHLSQALDGQVTEFLFDHSRFGRNEIV